MYHKSKLHIVLIFLTITLLMMLVTTPLYSQDGGGRGNGGNSGQGQQQGDQVPPGQEKKQEQATPEQDPAPEQEEPVEESAPEEQSQQGEPVEQVAPLSVPEQTESLLGCQKNNPDRLDCSSLEVTGYCDGTTAVFIITNTGESGAGDMVSATSYQILQNGNSVASGSVQIGGGQSTEVRYDGAGDITFMVNQQVGHPGNSQPQVTLNCGVLTEEPSPEPTEEPTPEETPTEEVTPDVTPTEEVTPEVTPTEEVTPPDLYASSSCADDGSVNFSITNFGAGMTEPVYYTVTDGSGNLIGDGWLQLDAGEEYVLNFGPASGAITLNIADAMISVYAECYAATEEVDPDDPILLAFSSCDANGAVVFEIINFGGDMLEPVYYSVTDMNNNVIGDGWVQLVANDILVINLGFQSGPVTLVVGDWLTSSVGECIAITEEPTPTEEVTPEVTPTEEVTPEVTPTEEVTPEVTPTEEVTPEVTPTEEVTPSPNCQKNNPDRLDCSSLEVTGYCDGTTAVFIITNTGEQGEGDMVQSTSYRLIQDGAVVESGFVQIAGGETMEVRYDGGGRITLEADQQFGHPGNSLPQTTLTCGG